MPTTIRLTRLGKKKRPFYRLVVLDSRERRDGAYLANLGYYNPFVEPPEVSLHTDEIIDWMGKGASVSETARSLLKREGVLYQFSLNKAGLDEAAIAQKMQDWRVGATARVARDEQDRQTQQRQVADADRERRDTKAKAAAEAKAAESAGESGGDGEAAPEGEDS